MRRGRATPTARLCRSPAGRQAPAALPAPPGGRPSLAGQGAGFTTAEPWLPVVTGAESLYVESQQQDPGSSLAFVRKLIHLRSCEPTLQSSTLRLFDAAADVFCFERELERRFLIALNFSPHRVPLALGDNSAGSAFLELSTHPGREHGAVDLQDLVLDPEEGLIPRLSTGGADRS
jgi:alpha-glucosidase